MQALCLKRSGDKIRYYISIRDLASLILSLLYENLKAKFSMLADKRITKAIAQIYSATSKKHYKSHVHVKYIWYVYI